MAATSLPAMLSGDADNKMMDDDIEFPRAMVDDSELSHEDHTKFIVRKKVFQQQFAAIYFTRLKMLRNTVKEAGEQQIKGKYHFCKYTVECEQFSGKRIFVIGTLYKDMKLKPGILDEYNEKFRKHEGDSFISEDDSVALEDEYGRISLAGKALNVPGLVTGVVAGVVCTVGAGDLAGQYEVEQVVFPGLCSQTPRPALSGNKPRFALITSGLMFGEASHNPLATQLLADYVTGFLGGSKDQQYASQVERVIIAGNSLFRPKAKQRDFSKLERNQKSEVAEPLKHLDMFLTQLAASVKVDMMPGQDDPTNFTLPQQPLHPCLFTSARTYTTLQTHSNPCYLSSSGVRFLGSSGQNISDITKYASGTRLEGLEKTLNWRLIAPTAPDSLACYPFEDNDPFVMTNEDSLPHVYFAANQPAFETKMIEGPEGQKVRLILVPSFAQTNTVVLVNLEDLSVHPMTFETPPPSTTG